METLDKCFENVCELDLIFHVDKVGNAHESFRAEYLNTFKVFVSRNEHYMRSDMMFNFLSEPFFNFVLQQLTPDILFFFFFLLSSM